MFDNFIKLACTHTRCKEIRMYQYQQKKNEMLKKKSRLSCESNFHMVDLLVTCNIPLGRKKSVILTTSVRRQRVPAGALGSSAACRSHTLIFL